MTDPLQSVPDREATPLELCIYWSNQLSRMADDDDLPVKAYEELKLLRKKAAAWDGVYAAWHSEFEDLQSTYFELRHQIARFDLKFT